MVETSWAGNPISPKVYGLIRPDGPPTTADTLFNAASMSKSFTASAVALLVDDKANHPDITWDTVAADLNRQDCVLADPTYTSAVTLRDMLSHRTGLLG